MAPLAVDKKRKKLKHPKLLTRYVLLSKYHLQRSRGAN
jgi:hypothetical protein